jgi:hypothetical protein
MYVCIKLDGLCILAVRSSRFAAHMLEAGLVLLTPEAIAEEFGRCYPTYSYALLAINLETSPVRQESQAISKDSKD